MKIFQHKVYIKGMKFLVKAQWSVQNMEKYIFAFLDELGHLEAKKQI